MRLALAGLVMLCAASPASAQGLCGPHAEVVAQLLKLYQERSVAAGMSANGTTIEVLSSPEGRTWTALVTTQSGNTCVVMSGENLILRLPRTGRDG